MMSIWLCSILVALNSVSYVAQLCNLQRKKCRTGDSLFYFTFNILSAAEQTNLCHWYSGQVAKESKSDGDIFAQSSRQWMALSQIATIWMVFSFVQFFTSLSFSSQSFRRKTILTMLFGLYGLSILAPLVNGNSRRTMAEAFTTDFAFLLLYISPAVIYASLCAFYAFSQQLRKTRPYATSPLALAGIASQVIVHSILAISWALMVRPRLNQILTMVWPALILSYNFFWWPLVDNTIFTILQGRLLWIALRRKKVSSGQGQCEFQNAETDPHL